MFYLSLSRIELYTKHSGAIFWLGVLLLSQPFILPRGWGLGVFTGFALLSLSIYAFAFRRWRTEPGLWMLATLLVVLWTPCWAYFEFAHWRSVFAKHVAQPAAPALTWPQIRFLIDAVLGLSVMAESIRLAMTVTRENWRVSRELKAKITGVAIEELIPREVDRMDNYYHRFTDRARKVLQLAHQEALRFRHQYIGTEHILLGLLREGSGVGAAVLNRHLGVDLNQARLETERLLKPGPTVVKLKQIPQTPHAKRVIESAIEEARSLHHDYVGSEHLLLGLLSDQESVAAQVLMNLGVRLDIARQALLELLGPAQNAM